MFCAFLIAAALAFTPADARVAYDTARGLVSQHTPRNSGTIRSRMAANYLLDAASAAGANVRRDTFRAMTPDGERQFTNLYAEFGGTNECSRWVVLVSHYDTKPGMECPGANDGASTSGLLVALAGTLSSWRERKGRVLLVWTDGEECRNSYAKDDGFQGSKRAAQYVRDRKLDVQAVICLDMLGDRELNITIPSNGDGRLAKIAQHAARRIGEPNLVRLADEIAVKDDHVAFYEKGMPSIDLIDFSYGPANAWWHTSEDTMDKISEVSLLKSGRLVTEMLNIFL